MQAICVNAAFFRHVRELQKFGNGSLVKERGAGQHFLLAGWQHGGGSLLKTR